jgi:hypothetical protein
MVRQEGYVARKGEMINAFKISVGKQEAKAPLEKHGHKWKATIKLDLKKQVLKKFG